MLDSLSHGQNAGLGPEESAEDAFDTERGGVQNWLRTLQQAIEGKTGLERIAAAKRIVDLPAEGLQARIALEKEEIKIVLEVLQTETAGKTGFGKTEAAERVFYTTRPNLPSESAVREWMRANCPTS